MRFRALSPLLPLAIGLVLSMATLPALAADPTRTGLAAPRTHPGPTLHGELKLALADAIAMGLENNLNVEIQRHAPLIADEDYRIAWGSYDPEWTSEIGWQDAKTPNSRFVEFGVPTISEEQTLDGTGGLQGLVPWLGASYSATLQSTKLETNSPLDDLVPEYRTTVVFSGSIPLMKGLVWNEPWTLVKTAQVLREGAAEEFRRNVMDIVQQIENAYWDLIANDELVRVAETNLETSRALLDQVQTQYEVGVVSKVEIAQAEAGVASAEFDLIVAENRYQTAMDVLIDLVLGPSLTADSRIQIEPTDRPDEVVHYDVDVEEAARIAFEQRPELSLAQKDIDRLEINLKFAKNQRLPQFDVEGSYQMQGLSGEPRDPASPSPWAGPWSSTFDNFFSNDAADTYGIRGILSIPIPNTAARRGVSKAELELRRARVQKKRVEQTIILEVRKAARDLVSSEEGIAASERQVAAAAEQLRAEQVRLEYGESTPFEVLLRQRDLVSAEQGKIDAFQAYRSSVTGLDRSQGTILRNRNISIDRAARLR